MFEQYNGKVLKLGETRVWRTYEGGALIDKWHDKKEFVNGNFPEDWVASTTTAINPNRSEIVEGLSKVLNLPNSPTLKDVLEDQAEFYFGKDHLNSIGNTAGMLIKLIDAHERLTIQTHPDKKFAKEIFKSDYGKTEAWYILDTSVVNNEEACIYFGFKPHVTRDIFKDVFDRQDIKEMLNCLHKIPVKPGDSFFIPGGLPHAIGAGCFLAEVQEPTDFTMRTELVTPGGLRIHENQCHQGCGYDLMLDCFHYDGTTLEETKKSWMGSLNSVCKNDGGEIFSIIDNRFTNLFEMRQINVLSSIDVATDKRVRVLIVTEGSGELTTENEVLDVKKGDYLLIAANINNVNFKTKNTLKLVECLPQKI